MSRREWIFTWRELKMSRGELKMSRRELKMSRREWIFTWRELKMSRRELKMSRREWILTWRRPPKNGDGMQTAALAPLTPRIPLPARNSPYVQSQDFWEAPA